MTADQSSNGELPARQGGAIRAVDGATEGRPYEDPPGERGKKVVGGLEILSDKVRREVEGHLSPHERVLFCIRGNLSHSLIALDDRLVIVKQGFHAGTTWGSLVTTFYYQDVTGIQVHTFFVSGWIEVSSPSFQGRERKRNRQPRRSDRDPYKLPNCVPISKRKADQYQPALARLRERIAYCKRYGGVASEPPAVLGSLERIADLHRSGALSDPEYERLKKVVIDSAHKALPPATPQTADVLPDDARAAS